MPQRHLRCLFATMVLLAAVRFCCGSPAVATDYIIEEIGTFGGTTSWARGVNNGGKVVGYAKDAAGNDRAFLYADGNMVDLGTLGGPKSLALDINDYDQVVGQAYVDGMFYHAFLWQAGLMTDLGTLPGRYDSIGFALNDLGQVVGNSLAGGDNHAFLFDGSSMTDLGTLGGSTSEAKNINDSGQIVGHAYTDIEERHAFYYSGGVMTDLGTFGGKESAALGINASGLATGWARSVYAPNTKIRAFLYKDAALINLGTYNDGTSKGLAINDRGQIVGYAQIGYGGPSHAILVDPEDTDGDGLPDLWYRQGAAEEENELMIDLNDLLPADEEPNWLLEEAYDINELGQIVGVGVHDGQRRGFILTPLYELVITYKGGSYGQVTIDPEPNDPNQPTFRAGTLVTLTAWPYEGGYFDGWTIFDANHPDDANYATLDTNQATTILMDADRHVQAKFNCSGGAGPLLPLLAISLLGVVIRRRV